MHETHPPGRRLGIAAIAAVFLLVAIPSSVLAHAELESTSPGVGTTVTGPLDEVVLTFSEALTDGSFFRVEADGQQVARGQVDTGEPDRMVARTGSLQSGTYTVKWVAYGADRHQEKGDFVFTIVAATPPPATATPSPSASVAPTSPPTASPAATPGPTLTPVPVPTASPAPGPVAASGGEVIVPIAATLAVIGGLGLWLLRRQRRV